MTTWTPKGLAQQCRADGEFGLAVQYWTGGYRVQIGDVLTGVTIVDGRMVEGIPDVGPRVIALAGPADVWAPMLQTVPPRLANTVSVMVGLGLELDADPLLWWQYLPATERLTEKGLVAHHAIAGSTHTAMDNIGHFPMAENPELFMQYLEPILEHVLTTS